MKSQDLVYFAANDGTHVFRERKPNMYSDDISSSDPLWA